MGYSPYIVAFAGLPGAGKTTISQILVERMFRQGVFEPLIVSLGDVIKRYSADKRNYPFEWTQTQEGKARRMLLMPALSTLHLMKDAAQYNVEPKEVTVREVLQEDALEYRRVQGETGHVRPSVLRAAPRRLIFVDDVRTRAEIEALHRMSPGRVYMVKVYHWWLSCAAKGTPPPKSWEGSIEKELAGSEFDFLFNLQVAPYRGEDELHRAAYMVSEKLMEVFLSAKSLPASDFPYHT